MTETIVKRTDIDQFRVDVDLLLQKRACFIEKILPGLSPGKDYFEIKGHKSLGKSGAEKIASIYQLVATFSKDVDTMESFKDTKGLVVFVCRLTRAGIVVGEARGASVEKDHNSINSGIKLAEKRAFVSAVIRSTGLSDIFTSDLEDMSPVAITPSAQQISTGPEQEDKSIFFPKNPSYKDGPATEKQKALLEKLIKRKMRGADRSRWLREAETATKFSASELISSFFLMDSR